MEHLEG